MLTVLVVYVLRLSEPPEPVIVAVRVTGTVVTSVDVDCVPPLEATPPVAADVTLGAAGAVKAQYDDTTADVLE